MSLMFCIKEFEPVVNNRCQRCIHTSGGVGLRSGSKAVQGTDTEDISLVGDSVIISSGGTGAMGSVTVAVNSL